MTRFYVVQTLRLWKSISYLGVPLDGYDDAPGCVGFLPVFDTEDAAKAWCREHEHPERIAVVETAREFSGLRVV